MIDRHMLCKDQLWSTTVIFSHCRDDLALVAVGPRQLSPHSTSQMHLLIEVSDDSSLWV